MKLSLRTPAKVNLSLLVGPPRPDGYHELFTVFTPLGLYDLLLFDLSVDSTAERSGTLSLDCPVLSPVGETDPEDNLAIRALRAVERASGYAISGRVTIEKDIPVGAGLGGGSSDAAAALVAGARLVAEDAGVELRPPELHALASSLGADVPFFLGEGSAVGRGIGDRLQPISLPSLPVAVVLRPQPLATPAVYAAFDRSGNVEDPEVFARRADAAEKAWRRLADVWAGEKNSHAHGEERDEDEDAAEWAEAVASLLDNDLEAASFMLRRELPAAKRALLGEGVAGALMSGSGPTLFGLCHSTQEAVDICERLAARGYAARPAMIGGTVMTGSCS